MFAGTSCWRGWDVFSYELAENAVALSVESHLLYLP